MLELLIVISILALLSSISIVVLNAKRHTGEARNVRRSIDVQTLSLGLYQYALDNGGNYPDTITATPSELCRFEAPDCTGLIDVSYLYGKYITWPIFDPSEEGENGTGYTAALDSNGNIVVNSLLAENDKVIFSTR